MKEKFRSNHFNFVHSQLVAGGINRNRWTSYVQDCFRVLKPGGWLQMVEIYYNAQSDNGSLTDYHALRQWSAKYLEALGDLKNPRASLHLRNMMIEAGFVDLESRMIPLPLSGWSQGTYHSISVRSGSMTRENICLVSCWTKIPFSDSTSHSFNVLDGHLKFILVLSCDWNILASHSPFK